MHVLEDQTEPFAQLLEIEIADVYAVHQNASAGDVVKPQQQIDQRRLPAPVAPTMPTRSPGLTSNDMWRRT